MAWSSAQRLRLGKEKEILEKYFPDKVEWIDPTGEAKVQVLLTSNSNKKYTLQISLPSDFPHSCPELRMISPQNLFQKNGDPVPSVSYEFHTLGEEDGIYTICHYDPDDWIQDSTLYQVFMKGRLWIEGYEGHLRTGENIDHFLSHQKPSWPSDDLSSISDSSNSSTDNPGFFSRIGKKISSVFRRGSSDSSD